MHAGAELEQAQPHLCQGGRDQLGGVQQQAAEGGVTLFCSGSGPFAGVYPCVGLKPLA